MKKTFSNQFFVSFTKWVVTSILYLNSNIRFSERTFFKIRNKRNTPHYQKPNKVCVRVPRLSLSDKFIISSLWTNGVGGRLYISTLWSRPCWKDYKLQAVNTEFYQPTDVEMSVTSITMSSLLAERGLYEVNNDGSFKWFGVKQDRIMMTCVRCEMSSGDLDWQNKQTRHVLRTVLSTFWDFCAHLVKISLALSVAKPIKIVFSWTLSSLHTWNCVQY